MTAGNRIRYFFVAFYVDPRIDRFALERICHILFAGVCKRTVIFAKMASKTPLFIYIYTFHCSSSLRVGAGLSFLNRERLSLPRIGINIVAITIPAVP